MRKLKKRFGDDFSWDGFCDLFGAMVSNQVRMLHEFIRV